jgi:tRNA nucleotidyltransferase (CCA-adding enzyme)
MWLGSSGPLLRGLPIEVLLHLMARADENSRRQFSIFVTNLSLVKSEIDGNDLKALGLKPCPLYREILDRIRDAKLDGRVVSKEDELQLAHGLIRSLQRADYHQQLPEPLRQDNPL